MDKDKREDKIDIALNAFSNAVSDQDRKLWTQEATAKYYKMEYNILLKESAQLDNQIKNKEEKLKKMEKKIPEFKKTKEGLMSAISTGSNIVKYLIERRNDVRTNLENWKRKINEKQESMQEFVNEERKKREKNNELYVQVQNKRNAFKLSEIHYGILLKKREELRRQIKMRLEINQQLFHSKIVAFVRALTNFNQTIALDKEIEAAKITIKQMALKLNKPPQTKLPSYQTCISREFLNRPTPTPWNMVKFPQPKMMTTSNAQDSVDFKELQQRSIERKRQFLHMLTVPLNTSDTSEVNKVETTEDKQVKKAATSIVPSNVNKKIKLHQDVVILKPAEETSLPKKQEDKKIKKVSFGEVLSQEQENMFWSDNDEEQNQNLTPPTDENVSKYFHKSDDNVLKKHEDKINKSVGYSFISPETSFENINESANQTIGGDFFITPQPNAGEEPSIFDFGFGGNRGSTSNQFSFF